MAALPSHNTRPGLNGHAAGAPDARPLHLDDLVARPPLHIDRDGLRRYLSTRTVLVTGAGGSIGTELARQLHALHPAHLVLIDVSEHNLFELERRFDRAPRAERRTFRLADVRDARALKTIFETHRPDVVLHAAAYKHVPLMERHPHAAFENNTVATARLLRQCDAHGVEQFVLVSTDKAVEPTSVLGATKRLAEWYVRGFDAPVTRKIVRFGNVFGSRGSVVPHFERQLAEGRPLEVTHPDMERYFMSAEEACGLILQTLLLDAAPIYALKMGEPVRIQWLAEAILRHRAPERNPAEAIIYTGRRPGEKLREQLYAPAETVRPSGHPRILGLHGPLPVPQGDLEPHLDRLARLAAEVQDDRLREALFASPLHASDAA